jgi:putative flippase GtrA
VRVERFVIVGALCALLSNAAVIGLVRYGFGTLSASLLAFGPVLVAGYTLHSAFTFGTAPARLTFARYALGTASNFPIWIAALYLLVDVLRISIGIAAPVATALIFLWSYLTARWAWGSRSWVPWKR